MPTIRNRWRHASLAWLIAGCALAGAARAHEASPVRADFDPPAPGTYQLERIQRAPEGTVLDARGRRQPLSTYTRGGITVLALMYTSCSDAKGCPLALHSMIQLRSALERRPAARGHVKLVSLSFDPVRDTPAAMREYAGTLGAANSAVRWHFLTTASTRELLPLLEGFGQDVSVPADGEAAAATGELSHVLKVFLIDRDGWVREIYTTAFLVPKVLLNDVETLMMEERGERSRRR